MNWFEFIFSSFIFLTFIIFILILSTNKISNFIYELKTREMKTNLENFQKILFSYGFPENWQNQNKTPISFGIYNKIFFRPLIFYNFNQRSIDIVSFPINFDLECKKNIYDKSIRIIDDSNNEINYTMFNNDYCENGGIKRSNIVFFEKINETKKYYVYYFSEKTIEKNYTVNNSLVAYWDFEEVDLFVKDKTQNENNGLIMNKIQTNGKFGKALNFSDNTFVNISQSNNLNNTQISIELWINISDYTQSKIIEKYNSYGIDLDNNKIKGYIFNLPENLQPLSDILETNKWYHIVFSSDGYSHKIYIDGYLYNETIYNSPIPTTSGPLSIGANYQNEYNFHGIIDEVRIYNSVLSDQDVFYAVNSEPLNFVLNPEIESEIVSINKIEYLKNIDLEELSKLLGGNYKFYVEVYK